MRVVSFYRFTHVDDPHQLGEAFRNKAAALGLLGTAIVASEGLNATIAGEEDACRALLAWLSAKSGFAGLSGRWSQTDTPPFHRLRIKYRQEIVSMGRADINPADGQGRHVDAVEWHRLLSDPGTLVIDTRNDYEVEVGSFEGAIDPGTRNFREFTGFINERLAVDKKRPVAMFCTGGIRCEKATAVMKDMGFENVFQLNGGILGYLDEVSENPDLESRWHGECFVFDSRVAVDQSLAPGAYSQCHGCRRALSESDIRHPHYEPGICCARCHETMTGSRRQQFEERRRQVALADARGEKHIGAKFPSRDSVRRSDRE